MAVVLISDQTTVLPNPTLTDSNNGLNTVNLRRTMTGARVTYVKSRERKRYLWSFKLTTEKAWELRAFVKNYGSNTIQIRDWLGNMFYANIKSNPIEFNHAEVDKDCWAESVEVTLEWEGIPMPAHPLIVVTVPADQNVAVGVHDLAGMISFVYNFSETVTVNMTVNSGGTLTFSAPGPGIISVNGNGTGSVTISGSMTAINTLFAASLLIDIPGAATTHIVTVTASAASPPDSTIESFDMVT